jgi:glucan phosphoethanolaminetransferase (alkaline phosphatase superfamily)
MKKEITAEDTIERLGLEKKPKLFLYIVIASYLPFIGIVWASQRQLKNKLYVLWHWFASMILSSIAFAKCAIYFNWL